MKRSPDQRITENPKPGPQAGLYDTMTRPSQRIEYYGGCPASRGDKFHPEEMKTETLQFGAARASGSLRKR